MSTHLGVIGTFPDTGMIHVGGIGIAWAGDERASGKGGAIERKWMGMLLAAAFLLSSPAIARQAQSETDRPAQAQPTGSAEQPSPPSLGPSMTGPLHLNSDPLHVDRGPLGPIYVSGVISGLGFTQSNHGPSEPGSRIDLSNGMAIMQTTQGIIQFYAQAGAYSFPSLGVHYFKAEHWLDDSFGLLPVAYMKIAPFSDFNVQLGKLYTLQGAENAFTFQNFNIERGLLWNQTATINRGIQANYAHGPLSVSLSVNDGFYSKKYNWLSGTIGYALSSKDSITFGAAANLGHTNRSSFTTPTTLNNGQLYFLSWTHTEGPWTIQPYVQLEHVHKDVDLGISHSASSYGGAILGKYSFNDQWALAARAEYINSSGSISNGAPSLIYGPGSGAWSFTLTPTWQKGIWFARVEGSYVHTHGATDGFALGVNGDKHSQARGLIEAGIIF